MLVSMAPFFSVGLRRKNSLIPLREGDRFFHVHSYHVPTMPTGTLNLEMETGHTCGCKANYCGPVIDHLLFVNDCLSLSQIKQTGCYTYHWAWLCFAVKMLYLSSSMTMLSSQDRWWIWDRSVIILACRPNPFNIFKVCIIWGSLGRCMEPS